MKFSALYGELSTSGCTWWLVTAPHHGWFWSPGHRFVQSNPAELQESLPPSSRGICRRPVRRVSKKHLYTEKYMSICKGIYKVTELWYSLKSTRNQWELSTQYIRECLKIPLGLETNTRLANGMRKCTLFLYGSVFVSQPPLTGVCC